MTSYGARRPLPTQIEGNNINADLCLSEQAGTPPFTEPSGDNACDSSAGPVTLVACRSVGRTVD
jgi:hypothetical protein